MKIHGAFAPVPTPLTRDDRFDPEALGRHLHWLAAEGLDGALILGSNGEFPSLSLAERTSVARAAAASGADLRLILNVGSCCLAEVERMVHAAAECAYHAVLCPPPFYFRAAPVAGLAAFLTRVLDMSSLPVLLYHVPQTTGVPISDELLAALGEHPNLAGIKDSSGSDAELRRLSRVDLSYLVGNDHLLSTCLAAGGKGSITAAASVAPRLVTSVAHDPTRQQTLDELRNLLEGYGLIPAVKALLRHQGLGDYHTRPPLQDLDEDQSSRLISTMSELSSSSPW